MVQQFAYIYGVVVQFFSLKINSQNPNLQNNSFSIPHTGFTIGYKKGQEVFPEGAAPRPQGGEHYGLDLLAKAFTPWTKLQKISH